VPFAHNGKRATIEKSDHGLLLALRKWATQYFGSHDGVTKDMYKALNKVKNTKEDFDIVVKIT
jgi:hypothetical protein